MPDPARTGALADRGLLGRMALAAPGLLEPSGAVQVEAIRELQRLPRNAWERAVASRHLVALRMELPQDGSEEDREFLMNSLKLVDDMLERHGAEAMKRGHEQGLKQGLEQGRNAARLETLRHAIRTIYESRFGACPRRW